MIDLNDIQIFQTVAELGSFTAAAKRLGRPKSTVSRCVARLERQTGVALFARTTRRVGLTTAGIETLNRLKPLLSPLIEAVDEMGSAGGRPHGLLRVRAGIGFGINVLTRYLPGFLAKYPAVRVSLDLSSKLGHPVKDHFDVGLQLGPLPDSSLSSILLGRMRRCLCASPEYLKRRGRPGTVSDLGKHDTLEMPRGDGRPGGWTFKRGSAVETVELRHRVCVNDAITLFRLVQSGVGLGIVSHYICRAEIAEARIIQLFADWTLPPVEVNLVHLAGRELSPTVRAFSNYMKTRSTAEGFWRDSDC